jgi:hypothetical protein
MEKQLKLYLEKIKTHSIKDSYVIKNMKNLYDVKIKLPFDETLANKLIEVQLESIDADGNYIAKQLHEQLN